MKRITAVLAFLIAFVLPAIVFAQNMTAEATNSTAVTIPDVASDPGGFFKTVFEAVTSGKWLIVAAAALVAIVWAARTFLGGAVPFFKTDKGGVVLALVISLLGAVSNALAAGHAVNAELIVTALTAAGTAMGGWVGVRKLLGIDNASKVVTSNTDGGSQ